MLSTFLAVCAPSDGRADWINLSGAEVASNITEIRIDRSGVHVALEIYVGDIETFADLLPRDMLTEERRAIVIPEAERLDSFARTGIRIEDDRGRILAVEQRLLEPRKRVDRRGPFAGMIDPVTGRKMPEPPPDPRVIYTELFYPFIDAEPASITVSPPTDPQGVPSASIGMIVFHHEVPVIDFRYLAAPAQLALDWRDPWYSKFADPGLTRHHRDPHMSFIYAEPYEIRHEVLIRARKAMELTGMAASGETLTGEQIESLIDATAAAIAERSPMTIDGKPVTPDFDRGAYMRIGPRGLVLIEPGEAINVDAAVIGLIWSAPTDGLPKQATATWSIFDEDVPQVPGYAIDAAGPFLMPLTPDDPVLVWTNHFKKPPVPPVEAIDAEAYATLDVPVLSSAAWLAAAVLLILALRRMRSWKFAASASAVAALGVAGGFLLPHGNVAVPRPALAQAEMSDEDASQLADQLLTNVYRAFDFRGERQVYDRLALTVDGNLLEEIYLDQRRTLRIARAGGAEARVQQVAVESAQADPRPGTATEFNIRVRWTIVGRVGHWGHIHQRQNAYEADVTISAESGTWKIIGFDVLSQDRLS